MRRKVLFKVFLFLTMVITLSLLLMIYFSPYGSHPKFEYKLVIETVQVNTAANEVYEYLGNSDNARDWSSFVDHITTLNPEEYQDGTVGSKRRCFRNESEEGMMWDEEILINELNKRRRLSIFNMKGFSLSADELRTEQLYNDIGNGKCEVSLTLFFDDGKEHWLDELKFYYAAYDVSDIFKANLENIKRLNEGG